MPPLMSNKGNYTGSLANLTRWLGEQAEGLGVMVFPGFPAAEVIYGDDGRSRASSRRTWASRRMVRKSPISSRAWKSTPSTPCSQRARAAA